MTPLIIYILKFYFIIIMVYYFIILSFYLIIVFLSHNLDFYLIIITFYLIIMSYFDLCHKRLFLNFDSYNSDFLNYDLLYFSPSHNHDF